MYHENYQLVAEPVERLVEKIQPGLGAPKLSQSAINSCGRDLNEIRHGLEYALLFTNQAEEKQAILNVLRFSNGTLRDIVSDTNSGLRSHISSRIAITIQLIYHLFAESGVMSSQAINAVHTDSTALQKEILAAASQVHCKILDMRWDYSPIRIYIDTCMPEDSIGYLGFVNEIIRIFRAYGFKTNPECIYVYQEYDDDQENEPEWWQ